MKKFVVMLLVMILGFTIPGFGAMFSDVDVNHWAEKSITTLVAEGVVKGMGNGKYEPESFITREQFLKMLLIISSETAGDRTYFEALSPLPYEVEIPFTDVDKDRWSARHIASAVEKGIILAEEYGEKFVPITNITREEAAVWIARALKLEAGNADFTDNQLIGKPALVGAVYEKGIIKGFTDGTFRPGEYLTRAQAAVMLLKAENLAVKNITAGMSAIKVIESKDFDGDGALDRVEILGNGKNFYAIKVGEKLVLGDYSYDDVRKYYSFDMNSKDNYLELAVLESADSYGSLRIYRYTGENLYSIGEIGSNGGIRLETKEADIGNEWGVAMLGTDGSFIVNAGTQFVHTMLVRKIYRMDNENLRLTTVGDAFETLGEYSNFTLKRDITLMTEKNGGESIVVSAGYAGKIVKTDLKEWIYIEMANGFSGWVKIENGKYINGESVLNYFTDLHMAG